MIRTHATAALPSRTAWTAVVVGAGVCALATGLAGCASGAGAGSAAATPGAAGASNADGRLRVAVVRTAGSEIAGFTMADFEKASWTRTAEGGAQLDILLTPAATQRLREASGKAKAKGSELFLAATWDGTRVEPRTRLHGEIGAITIRNPQLPDPAGWAAEVTRLVNADRR
ncbi:MAG: hypothetical protein U0625_01310 [Phycisphaerales bacterium]